MKKRIVIVGTSFAGYSTALSLAKLLHDRHEITVIDRSSDFMFLPSLVWHPFGYRHPEDISFDTLPIFDKQGIKFIETTVYGFDLDEQLVITPEKDIPFDYLVIATGTKANYDSVKGYVPGKTSWSICSMAEAERTRKAWKDFLRNPGPLVIGASQWAGYFFAAYEFMMNALYQLKSHHLLKKVPVHFITAEPYLTHFGIGSAPEDSKACEAIFDRYNIQWNTSTEIRELKEREVILENGERIVSDFNMIIPQFIGVDAVRTTRNLANPFGLIHVNEKCQHRDYPNIYAAGSAVYIPQKEETLVPCGVPRTRYSSEIMAKAVAYNIASDLIGGGTISIPVEGVYEYCKQDMDHLGAILFRHAHEIEHDLDFIAKGSQEKWANMSIETYIENSFELENLNFIN